MCSARDCLVSRSRSLLAELIDDEEYTDVTFMVGAEGKYEELRAHKCVVCKLSDVFRVMFKPNTMHEAMSNEVTIRDSDPTQFRVFLKFLYLQDLSFQELLDHGKAVLQWVYQYQLSTRDQFVGLLLQPDPRPELADRTLFSFMTEFDDALSIGRTIELLYSNDEADPALRKLRQAFHDHVILTMRRSSSAFELLQDPRREQLRRAVMYRLLESTPGGAPPRESD